MTALATLERYGDRITAADLTRAHLGRLVMVQTGVALYVGRLGKVAHYPSTVYLRVEREEAKADLDLKPDDIVTVEPDGPLPEDRM